MAGADERDALPPPFLLPDEIEYESLVGSQIADLRSLMGNDRGSASGKLQTTILWADQLFSALPPAAIGSLRDAVRSAKLRWERGFASVLLEGPLVCGVGACDACAVELRRGVRLPCVDGPVFDLKDMP
jgi:dihydroorotate dehydrogenase electron transfer subunit